MKVASIIVTYNRSKLLVESLEAMLKMKENTDFDIFVIDNNSSDGTKEILEKYINNQQINYFNTGSNLGGAGGFNFGLKQVAKLEYDYAYLIDDDAVCSVDTLEKLLDFAKDNKDFGFLSSKVIWTDNSLCNMNIPKISLFKKISSDTTDVQKIQYATFVSILINMEAVKKLGLPIKEFFIWTDDFEYTRRISKQYNCYYVPQSIILHNCEDNNGSNIVTATEERIDRFRYKYRNEEYLYKREGIKGRIFQLLKNCYHILKVIIKSKELKKEKIKLILDSTKEGRKFNPNIEMVE
ncbi:MAG: glycosyltransferase [Clostridia bacterium]|nr:glycosyltransferase [Clostridia bacterium]